MPKYILAYHNSPTELPEGEQAQQDLMAAWGAWFAALGDSLVDPGNPIALANTIAPDGSVTPDGGLNPLTGYGIITADNLDAAVDAAKGCPVLGRGGSVEVAEAIDM